jgi:hypothetical protein
VRNPGEKFHNHELYDKTRNFVLKALFVLRPFIESRESSNLDFSRLLLSHRLELENIPEFKQCSQLMENEPNISKHIGKLVGVRGRLSSANSWDYFRRILSRLLKAYHKKKGFDERLFRKMYLDMETLFYKKSIPIVILIPLQNFESDISYISLNNDLCIRRITYDERQQYLLQDLQNLKITFVEATQIKHIVEYSFLEDKVFDEYPEHTDRVETVKKVITCLRLFKQGEIGSYIVLETSKLDTPILAGVMLRASAISFPEGKTYTLAKNEISKFRKHWRIFNKIDLHRFSELRIALDRFESAYERTSIDDKLLDYVICFEVLLGSKDDKDSLSYKISVRFSRLCRQDLDERKRYRRAMSEIYSLRSAIVHGNEYDKKKLWKKVNIEDVEGKLRETIYAYLKEIDKLKKIEKYDIMKVNHNSIIDRIDFV